MELKMGKSFNIVGTNFNESGVNNNKYAYQQPLSINFKNRRRPCANCRGGNGYSVHLIFQNVKKFFEKLHEEIKRLLPK